MPVQGIGYGMAYGIDPVPRDARFFARESRRPEHDSASVDPVPGKHPEGHKSPLQIKLDEALVVLNAGVYLAEFLRHGSHSR
jgi:hypothetical protein